MSDTTQNNNSKDNSPVTNDANEIANAVANIEHDITQPTTPPPGTSAPLGTHPGVMPSHMADFDATQIVEGGVNENPAHWGANADAQLGSTGKTSTDGDLTDDTSNLREKSE